MTILTLVGERHSTGYTRGVTAAFRIKSGSVQRSDSQMFAGGKDWHWR